MKCDGVSGWMTSVSQQIYLYHSINRPWATAESTSLREKGSERNETQQGVGPCHCCVIVTWCDRSHPRDTAVWPCPRAQGKAEQGINLRAGVISAGSEQVLTSPSSTRRTPEPFRGMRSGHTTIWERSPGTWATAHQRVQSVWWCATSESFGHHQTAW